MQVLLKTVKAVKRTFNNGSIMKQTLVFFLFIILLLPTLLTSCGSDIKGETAMIPMTTIPLIDANAPAKTETATFALG